MRFNQSGEYLPLGKNHKTLDFSVSSETMLPSWLVASGSSPVVTFSSPATSRGWVRTQTKSGTPTANDTAGIETAFNIDYDKFEEVFFGVYSCCTDGPTAQDPTFAVESNAGGLGFYFATTLIANGGTQVRVYPGAVESLTWQLATESNWTKRKDLGVVIRPRTKEFAIYTGDPAEGAGCIYYSKGAWNNPGPIPLRVKVTTQSAAQRYLELSRIKIRLSSN